MKILQELVFPRVITHYDNLPLCWKSVADWLVGVQGQHITSLHLNVVYQLPHEGRWCHAKIVGIVTSYRGLSSGAARPISPLILSHWIRTKNSFEQKSPTPLLSGSHYCLGWSGWQLQVCFWKDDAFIHYCGKGCIFVVDQVVGWYRWETTFTSVVLRYWLIVCTLRKWSGRTLSSSYNITILQKILTWTKKLTI